MTIPLFLVPVAAGLLAQGLKPLLSRRWRQDQAQRLDQRPRYGGMPSAHTAFATSLATLVSLEERLDSIAFAIAVAILILVLDDALRLRVFLGRFGAVIRRLVTLLPEETRGSLPSIEEHIGHTVPEVTVGALVGIVFTVALWSIDH